ncbi:MAG: DUF4141 domain-containing protein [Vicinamibacterales bacterium]
MRRFIAVAIFVVAVAVPVRAQWVVIDPGNLAQAILIADRTLQEYEALFDQYQTILRMARALGSLDSYRIPAISITSHDTGRWEYGRPWLQGLNSGDATGAAYLQAARRLERPGATLNALPAAARQTIERAYATIEITDSVAQMGGHQVALIRGYGGRLQDAIASLERDVVSTAPGYHETTAILDKIAAGELLGRRQDMAANQMLSHVLEQLLARSKRQRDTEAAAMNMRLGGLRGGRAASKSVVRGVADDLRTWRQP